VTLWIRKPRNSKLSRGSSRLKAEECEAKEKDLWIGFLAEIPVGNRKSRFGSRKKLNDL
jgi:hypothetical protein